LNRRWRITVLAGVNGAGKSSVGGTAIRREGTDYWNPDEIARAILESHPSMEVAEANAVAWQRGREHLETAIRTRRSFALETTLGGRTITRTLVEGIARGAPVHVWYVGLEGVDLHIERVRKRVEQGGHDIPEAVVRSRYRTSRENLVRLMPVLERLIVYDNSAGPQPDGAVAPDHLLTMQGGRIVTMKDLPEQPRWARPIIMTAVDLHGG